MCEITIGKPFKKIEQVGLAEEIVFKPENDLVMLSKAPATPAGVGPSIKASRKAKCSPRRSDFFKISAEESPL